MFFTLNESLILSSNSKIFFSNILKNANKSLEEFFHTFLFSTWDNFISIIIVIIYI